MFLNFFKKKAPYFGGAHSQTVFCASCKIHVALTIILRLQRVFCCWLQNTRFGTIILISNTYRARIINHIMVACVYYITAGKAAVESCVHS